MTMQSKVPSTSAELANMYYGKNSTSANAEDHGKLNVGDNEQTTKSPEHNTTTTHKQQSQPVPHQQTTEHFPNVQQHMQTLTHTQLMHSQSASASYGGHSQHHQPFDAYAQHQSHGNPASQSSTTLRNSAHYGSRSSELGPYGAYAHTQYTDYPPFGSQQQQPQQQSTQHQSSRYHNTSVAGSSAPQATSSAHPPTPSLTDFYASYYPQWSPFMLASTAAAGQTNDTGHLMHHPHSHSYTSLGDVGGVSGPSAHSSSHSSHLSKVQTTTTHQTNQWQQYHP